MSNESTISNLKEEDVEKEQGLTTKGKKMSTSYMVKVALFSALAFIVMYAEFPIGTLFPPYLKVDLSEVVVFIGGMILGPVAVIFMELIKNILNFMLKSSTGGVGELANFTVGLALVLPTVYMLRQKRSLPRIIIAFIVGIVTMVIVASVGNYFVFLPLYGVGTPADRLGMIIPVLIPFNIIKGLIVAVIGTFIHLSIRHVYKYLK